MFTTLFSHAKVLAIAGILGAGTLFAAQPANAANWHFGLSLGPVFYPAAVAAPAQPVYVAPPVYAPAPVYQAPVVVAPAAPCYTVAPAPVYAPFPIFYGDRDHRGNQWHEREHFDHFDHGHFDQGHGFDHR